MGVTLVLGLDIGSTSTKAALVDVSSGVHVRHVERRATPATVDGLLQTAAGAMRACAALADDRIVAVGIASMAESGAALDGEGHPLTPLLRWDRTVDRGHLDALLAAHPGLPERTGVPATTKPAAVALRALAPDVLRALRHWSGVADLVAHALTGRRAIDHTLAVRTMLMRDNGWDEDLCDELGVTPSALPEVRPPGAKAADTGAGAAVFGLAPGIPVHIAGHDHAVGAWAAGVRRPGDTADSLGTAEAVVRVTAQADRARAVQAGFAVSRTVDGGAITLLGGSGACGALLASWERRHPGALAFLQRAAPGRWATSPVTVLPYPAGRQCPDPDPTAFLRVTGDGGDDDRARGLLQSLVLHARWMRESADALAGMPTRALTLLGSLAERIPAWAPLAATSGVPTRRSTVTEPVAAGAALLAAVREHAASPDLALPSVPVEAADAPGLAEARRHFLVAVGTVPAPTSVPPPEQIHPREGES